VAVEHDEYLLEAYRQAGENARMYATSRFSNLTSFLTYMGLLTAAFAFLYANRTTHAVLHWAVLLVAVLGCVLSVLFFALEIRHHYWWEFYEMKVVRQLELRMQVGQYLVHAPEGTDRSFINDGRRTLLGLSATRATYGIYIASFVFFVFVGVVSFA
jgi:hypothetical protein